MMWAGGEKGQAVARVFSLRASTALTRYCNEKYEGRNSIRKHIRKFPVTDGCQFKQPCSVNNNTQHVPSCSASCR